MEVKGTPSLLVVEEKNWAPQHTVVLERSELVPRAEISVGLLLDIKAEDSLHQHLEAFQQPHFQRVMVDLLDMELNLATKVVLLEDKLLDFMVVNLDHLVVIKAVLQESNLLDFMAANQDHLAIKEDLMEQDKEELRDTAVVLKDMEDKLL